VLLLSTSYRSLFPRFPRAKVPRPKYSVLENRGLKLLGLNTFRPWQEGLRDYLGISQSDEAAITR
jgi:dTDP-4-dehydrorhamnose reductase